MYRLAAAACLLTLPALAALAADRLDPITETGLQRIEEGRVAQVQIDDVVAQTEDLVRDYRQLTRTAAGLNTYNQLLQKQVDSQLKELAALRASIQQVAVIERQIVPLLLGMIGTLDKFVQLDVPFLPGGTCHAHPPAAHHDGAGQCSGPREIAPGCWRPIRWKTTTVAPLRLTKVV